MKSKIVLITCIMLLLGSTVSSYYCISEEDNDPVKQFKYKMNNLALKNDIEKHNITPDAVRIKLKYFNPCKEW